MNLYIKVIRGFLGLAGLAMIMVSCEFFVAPEETLDVQTGEILFPSLTLAGDQYLTFEAGSITAFDDPGVVATLGAEDISDQVEVSGTVDVNTPGVYTIVYSVTTINALDQESTVTASRFINISSEDVSVIDLSGNYLGTGFSGAPTPKPVTQVAIGWYQVTDILGSGNAIAGVFAHVGGDDLVLPNQPGPFGLQNTTSPDTYATLTPTGFEWVVFISCCGNFGPIVWTKQ